MPPTLDLSGATHSKMLVSPPRINLRRAASYNHDKSPLSSTSSRFNFNHLVFSPPPSPGLPSLSPPLKKPSRGLKSLVRPRRIVRLVGWILGAVIIYYVATSTFQSAPTIPALKWPPQSQDQFEMVAQDELPDFATPVVVTDKKGKPRWTVSIPRGLDFPLTMKQYSDICIKCKEVSAQVKAARSHAGGLQNTHHLFDFGSNAHDNYFIDVQEAEDAGIIPSPGGKSGKLTKQGQAGDFAGESKTEKPMCQKSMTFVLQSSDAGIGNTLLMLWTAYGIALQEGRAFFIDDTRWAYGKYTDVFQPPPIPGCRAPPSHEMLPCPRQARHLVASAVTFQELIGSVVAASGTAKGLEPSDAVTLDPTVRRMLFDLAHQGYVDLFRVFKEDDDYLDAHVRELVARKIVPKPRGRQNGLAVGVHVRRGDQHPREYQYRDSYVPMDKYAEAAWGALDDRLNHTRKQLGANDDDAAAAHAHSFLLLASDDPLVYETDEFVGATRAQDRIKLASKAAIQEANPDRRIMRHHVDDAFGWEGGFFAAMFWTLGATGPNVASVAASHAASDARSNVVPAAQAVTAATNAAMTNPSAETIRLRSLVGRAYMMDLAVLADASDVVVCTVSAAGCRLLAVMMGWEAAMEKGGWINVDGGIDWTLL